MERLVAIAVCCGAKQISPYSSIKTVDVSRKKLEQEEPHHNAVTL
jgi:hypothetical protein